jgi:hypothetical protein
MGRGVPGHPVLSEDKQALLINPTRTKNEGEIVGVRNDQHVMVYALVCADNEQEAEEDSVVQQVRSACL